MSESDPEFMGRMDLIREVHRLRDEMVKVAEEAMRWSVSNGLSSRPDVAQMAYKAIGEDHKAHIFHHLNKDKTA
jgi:hypothetical protein